MEIQKTNEYEKFKIILGNRIINQTKVKRLIDDINAGLNLLPYCPIVVYKKEACFYIIDGQHRFETCKQIESPVYFVECDELELKQIARVNSRSDKWSNSDFLECYIKVGIKEYELLKYFIKKYKVGYATAIYFLTSGDTMGSNRMMNDFRDGEFEVKHLALAEEITELTKDVFSIYTFSSDRYLIAAVLRLKKAGKCDFKILKAKIKEDPNGMSKQGSYKDYLYNIERVYNFKRSIRQSIF